MNRCRYFKWYFMISAHTDTAAANTQSQSARIDFKVVSSIFEFVCSPTCGENHSFYWLNLSGCIYPTADLKSFAWFIWPFYAINRNLIDWMVIWFLFANSTISSENDCHSSFRISVFFFSQHVYCIQNCIFWINGEKKNCFVKCK